MRFWKQHASAIRLSAGKRFRCWDECLLDNKIHFAKLILLRHTTPNLARLEFFRWINFGQCWHFWLARRKCALTLLRESTPYCQAHSQSRGASGRWYSLCRFPGAYLIPLPPQRATCKLLINPKLTKWWNFIGAQCWRCTRRCFWWRAG